MSLHPNNKGYGMIEEFYAWVETDEDGDEDFIRHKMTKNPVPLLCHTKETALQLRSSARVWANQNHSISLRRYQLIETLINDTGGQSDH